MLAVLMLLAVQDPETAPETAIEAERAFNRSAQTEGQWTAFRKFSTPEAVLFTPQPEKAHEVLPKTDPKLTVQWWPAESYVSCDGSVAVNTGPWVRPKGVGYFTTVWVRQGDGHYKWVYDGGDELATPRALPEQPKVRRASCAAEPGTIYFEPCHPDHIKCHAAKSEDGTLVWDWTVTPDGARTFTARLWNGRDFDNVIENRIAAVPAK